MAEDLDLDNICVKVMTQPSVFDNNMNNPVMYQARTTELSHTYVDTITPT